MEKNSPFQVLKKAFKPYQKLIFLALLLLFLLTRFSSLKALPIFCDEAIYIRWAQIADQNHDHLFISLTDGKPPLHIWAMIPFLRIFSDPLVAGRITSGLGGLLLFLIFSLTAFFFFKKPIFPLLAGLLVIFTPYLLFFDRMALAESILTCFAAGSFLLAFLLGHRQNFFLAIFAGLWLGLALLVKSQAFFFLLLFPLGIIFNLKEKDRKKLKKFLLLLLPVFVLSLGIYNLQRVSPYMSLIAQKGQTFTVPLKEALADFNRLFSNLKTALSWFWQYLTPPLFLTSLLGLGWLLKKNWRQGVFLTAWILAPLLGASLIAQVFTSRYLAFLSPFFLLGTVYFFGQLWQKIPQKHFILLIILILALPVWRSYQLIFTPQNFPFLKSDRGYLEGWTAGFGIGETVAQIKEARQEGLPVLVGTEGFFGLLSQGLEIYFADDPKVEIVGFYPLPEKLPPADWLEKTKEKKVFFVVNNTPGDFSNDHFILRGEYPKINNTGSLRLYEVVE